jgi:hypothetical protein
MMTTNDVFPFRGQRARGTPLVLLAVLLLHPRWASGQPITRDVLDSADVARDADGATILTIQFRFPVNYVSHFPTASGETLAINVRPAVMGHAETDVPRRREALRPPRLAGVPLTDIVYDEEALWSPYLFLHFGTPVSFRVRQGRDGRSVVIEFPPTQATASPPRGRSPSTRE